MLINIIAGITAAILMMGCADNQIASTVKIQDTEIGVLQGTVTIGPICPVESIDDPCLPDPVLFTSHKLIILNEAGGEVQQVTIDEKGNYRTELMPGNYTVDFTPHDIGFPGSFQPPSAIIRAGETTILNIGIDTGIR